MAHDNGRTVGEQDNWEKDAIGQQPGEDEVEGNHCRDHVDEILSEVLHKYDLYAPDYKQGQCNTGPKIISLA